MSESVRARLQEGGLRVIQTPYRAPTANAHAERFVRSIKEECLDRLIPFGEGHFRRAVAEFVTLKGAEILLCRHQLVFVNNTAEAITTENASIMWG